MRKCGILIAIELSIVGILTGCGNVGNTIEMIQTPMLSNLEQDEVSKVLKEILPHSAEYLVPKKAEQKQSIFMEDIDGDDKDEAFILYRDTRENQQVHLLMLKEDEGRWTKESDIATSYNTLDYFKIDDLYGNGKKEVILGVSMSDSEVNKQLYIYELESKSLVKKVDRAYEEIDIADYNEDKKPEVILLEGERNKLQTAEMFSYVNGQLKSVYLVELNPDGIHENIVSGKLADGEKALFIDSSLGAHSMLTEIIAYNNGKLVKVGNEEDGVLFKAYPLYSRDINKDGITEVGGMYIPKGFEDAAMAEIPFIYTYSTYSVDGTKQTVEERYNDTGQNFYITIPSEWYDKVTVQKFDKAVKLIDNENQKTLFEVKWINKEAYIDSKIKLGETLGETENTIFYTDMKEELSISNANFHLSEDEF